MYSVTGGPGTFDTTRLASGGSRSTIPLCAHNQLSPGAQIGAAKPGKSVGMKLRTLETWRFRLPVAVAIACRRSAGSAMSVRSAHCTIDTWLLTEASPEARNDIGIAAISV